MSQIDRHQSILQAAETYSTQLLKEKLALNLVFHNYHHTLHVVEAAQEIGSNSGLNEEELHTVLIAAWFHDTGYSQTYAGHEDISMHLAAKLLDAQGAGASLKSCVLHCIGATKHAVAPQSLLEQVLCDADLSHLGEASFPLSSQRLREELELVTGAAIPDLEWHRQNLVFLEKHTYFTPYAKEVCDEQKKKNLEQVRRWLLRQNQA